MNMLRPFCFVTASRVSGMDDAAESRRAATLLTEAAEASRHHEHARAYAAVEEAARLYRDLAERTPNPELRVKALRGCGAALYQLTIEALHLNRPQEAIRAAQEAYGIIAQYGIRPERQLAKLNALRALGLLDLHRPSEALDAVEAAFHDLLREKDPFARAELAVRFTWLKGLILLAQERYEEAVEHLDRAYIHFQNHGQYNFWHFVGMAEALAAVGRHEDALSFYRVGVEYLKKSGQFTPFVRFRIEMLTSV